MLSLYIRWKEERVRLLVGSPGASTTPIYSPGSSSTPIYSPGASRNAECSNCKHLLDKITVLEAMLEMYKNPEQHTLNSAALLHEVYNDMGKLDLEYDSGGKSVVVTKMPRVMVERFVKEHLRADYVIGSELMVSWFGLASGLFFKFISMQEFEVLKEGVTRSESAAVEGVLTVFGEWTNLPQEFAWVPRWAASLPV
ncbi:hypothetical protein Tco_1485032 [Tanacetum coccineum]